MLCKRVRGVHRSSLSSPMRCVAIVCLSLFDCPNPCYLLIFFFVVLVGAFVGIRVSSGGLCRGDGIARIEVYVVEAVSFWCCFAFCDVGSEAFFAYCSAPAGIGSRIRVSWVWTYLNVSSFALVSALIRAVTKFSVPLRLGLAFYFCLRGWICSELVSVVGGVQGASFKLPLVQYFLHSEERAILTDQIFNFPECTGVRCQSIVLIDLARSGFEVFGMDCFDRIQWLDFC